MSEDLELDLGRRVLCPDGTCTGVIGPDGKCSECGRPGVGVGPSVDVGVDVDLAPKAHEHASESDAALTAPGSPESPASFGAYEAESGNGETGFDERRTLCPDGACTGVLGPDGRCPVCGQNAASGAAGGERPRPESL